ncbi:MAG TPA: squalene/phytoene synthase family protein, partial [Solirubrobacteraceae bacterium]|nr:squalene/phytoene synthase family protein [Solirubrobacteraceae bacterium]
QTVTRYETWDQLMEYCSLSANPVGELVLGVFGTATGDRIALSDRICSGLQVAEHLQDIAEDHGRGRVYLPVEDQERFGVDEGSLARAATPDGPLRGLIAYEAARAGLLLSAGAPLARTLPLRQRLAVAGFVAGGRAALRGLPGGADAGGAGTGARSGDRRRTVASAFPRAFLGR